MTILDRLQPANSVEDVLITEQLTARAPLRARAATGEAFVRLAEVMADSPELLPRALCDVAIELCSAGTAGISMLRRNQEDHAYFYWEALAGVYAGYVGGTTPRDFSPCGTTLDRGATQLYSYPGRYFTYLGQVSPPIVEGLVVPFYARGEPLGTIWIVSHDDTGFDLTHAQIMEDIGKFCGAAFSLLAMKAEAESARDSIEQRATELARANAIKDDFVSLVAHELRSPVATIYGNSRVLVGRADVLDPDDVELALRDIATESMRLNRALADLVVLARPERGGPEAEPLDLVRLCERVIEDHKKLHMYRDIILSYKGEPALANASPDYIEQVLRNLLSNAEKYSPEFEPVEVAIENIGSTLKVSVRDHGAGVPVDQAEWIFEMFYRAPDARDKATGMGIGLAVCKRLIDAQGGSIWVEPAADNGAVFCFALPLHNSEP